MNDQRIAIICDSGTDVPQDFCQEHDIRIIPLIINYSDGTSYRAFLDIQTDEVIRRFEDEIPTTSLPSPADIRAALEQAREDGYEKAILVTISSGLSATNQTAHLVASQMENFPVLVVDTLNIGLGAGLTVMAATRLVERGVPFDTISSILDGVVAKTALFFCTKTLKYLHHGGRINEATYRLGSLLNIKPVITCDEEGRYVTAHKARGWKRALSTEVSLLRERMANKGRVVVGICCTEDAMFDKVEAAVREALPDIAEVVRTHFSPELVVHTGPDCIGVTAQPVV